MLSPKPFGPPVILPGKPISIDNMYKIQNSSWNTTFVDQFGNGVNVPVSLGGVAGSYVMPNGDIGHLVSITYHNTFSGTPSMVTFSFSGRWRLGGQSGNFHFQNGTDQNSFDGVWTSDAGGNGTWTGSRVDVQTAMNDF